MRVLYLVFLIGLTYGADDRGQYEPDDSGQYVPTGDEGRYIPDNSGLYQHDHSGDYHHDDSGLYQYKGKFNERFFKYREDLRNFRNYQNHFESDNNLDRSKVFREPQRKTFFNHPKPSQSPSQNIIPTQSPEKNLNEHHFNPQIKIETNQGYETPRGFSAFGESAAGTSHNPTRNSLPTKFPQGSVYNRGRYDDSRWQILRQNGDVGSDGYHWDFETENGISAEETGKVTNVGNNLEAMKARGFFKYTGPDNVVYTVTYIADENGFVPQGNHLPTPPPIPEAILKSLEFQKSSRKL